MSSAAAAAAGMATPSPGSTPGSGVGRRRTTTPTYRSEDQALDQIAKEAEDRLLARRREREQARLIRMRELERQQKEAEELMDKEFLLKKEEKINITERSGRDGYKSFDQLSTGSEKLSKHNVTSNGTTIPSSVPASSSPYSTSVNTTTTSSTGKKSVELSEQQENLKDLLIDLEEKYKKAMMTNAQLDNEKGTLVYEVDVLKDTLEEQEEVMMELQRETRDKNRELEGKKRENALITKDIETLKEMVRQRDQLISEHGLLEVGDEEDAPSERSSKRNKVGTIVVVSPEAAELLEVAGDGPLDVRLKHFVEERKGLLEEIRKLRIDLEEERERVVISERRRQLSPAAPMENGPDIHEMIDAQREMGRQVQEYKFKLTRAEQEVTTLEGSVTRLEGQVKRYKTSSEQAEGNEEELKLERRKLTRENRSLRDKLEEIETENGHLAKRLEKMKTSRLAVK